MLLIRVLEDRNIFDILKKGTRNSHRNLEESNRFRRVFDNARLAARVSSAASPIPRFLNYQILVRLCCTPGIIASCGDAIAFAFCVSAKYPEAAARRTMRRRPRRRINSFVDRVARAAGDTLIKMQFRAKAGDRNIRTSMGRRATRNFHVAAVIYATRGYGGRDGGQGARYNVCEVNLSSNFFPFLYF